MMTNQREALDAAVREGMAHGLPGERAIIALLGALLDQVTQPDAETEPHVEESSYQSVMPEAGALGVLDGKAVGVWLKTSECTKDQQCVAVTNDGALRLIRFQDMNRMQRIGRPKLGDVPKPAFQPPMHEEVARDMRAWAGHPEPKAQERLRVVEGFGVDYDLLPSDIKSRYGSRFQYILSRAKSVDLGAGMVS